MFKMVGLAVNTFLPPFILVGYKSGQWTYWCLWIKCGTSVHEIYTGTANACVVCKYAYVSM